MQNNNFKLGYLHIDKYLNFDSNDLILLTSLNQIKTDLALNIISRNKAKCCYISTNKTSHQIQHILQKIKKANSMVDVIEEVECNKSSNFVYLEIPTIIEIVEEIVNQKDNCDYFIIDELTYIKDFHYRICSSKKEYQFVLQLLKEIIKLMNKPIVLLSQIDNVVRDNNNSFNYYYYLSREKYLDYALVLHYPYLAELIDDKTKSSLIIAKSKKNISKIEFDLCYNEYYCLFT